MSTATEPAPRAKACRRHAGRREQTSLSIYVAFDGPLDQHFMRNPHKLFSRAIETPRVDPHNEVLLQQHLVCASVELPLVPALDQRFFGAVRPNSCCPRLLTPPCAHGVLQPFLSRCPGACDAAVSTDSLAGSMFRAGQC